MIWEHFLPGPRLVSIQFQDLKLRSHEWLRCKDADDLSLKGNGILETDIFGIMREMAGHTIQGVTSIAPIPTILFQVCKESKEVALRHYTRAFSTTFADAFTYFDFDQDTLYLRPDVIDKDVHHSFHEMYTIILKLTDREELRKVKNLALLVDDELNEDAQGAHGPSVDGTLMYGVGRCLSFFGGVQNLSIVVSNDDPENESPDDPSLSLIEPIDIYDAYRVYNCNNPIPWENCDVEILHLETEWAEISPRQLQEWKALDDRDEPAWEIPQIIECKITIAAEVLEELNRLKQRTSYVQDEADEESSSIHDEMAREST